MWSTCRGVGEEMQELCERWYALCLAPRRKQVVCQMELTVIPAVVLPEENFDLTPRALDSIRVCPGVRIDEVHAVVNGMMRVTLRTEITVCTPAITNDRSAGFDPVTYYSHQCVGSSVLDGNKKCFPGLSFYTAKHPLTLNRVSL
jgi:hypothetical protein